MLKAIIFDVDGVLVDSMWFQADAWVKTFREEGITISREEIYELEGSNNLGLIKKVFEKAGKEPEPWHYEKLPVNKRDVLEFDRIKPFEGMPACLNQLKKHFRLAMVSGSNFDVVSKFANSFFPECFEVIITGGDIVHGKPCPDPYLKALEELALEKNECIVVENAPLGITAAKRAGLYCVAVASMLKPEKVKQADLVFENHAALLDYLKSLIPEEPKTE
jgi:beta-phosphoglucomutase